MIVFYRTVTYRRAGFFFLSNWTILKNFWRVMYTVMLYGFADLFFHPKVDYII